MTVLLCVCNIFNECLYWRIDSNSIEHVPETTVTSSEWRKKRKCSIDAISAHYLLQEIHQFTQFKQKLCENPHFKNTLLVLKVVPPEKEVIDYKWNQMTTHTLWQKIEVDHLMSWLSTLGGGFSALGEQFSKCAETAGKISLKQLGIGMRLGDPFLQARCKLYYSISLIQTGKLRHAKHIIRQQYQFAKSQKEADGRLLKMCLGIWLRLQHEYSQRLKQKDSEISTENILNSVVSWTE